MNKIHIAAFLVLLSSLVFSCTVSIDGAPCDPEQNNCPSGQYCSSEGICKRGNSGIKDIIETGDYIGIKDNESLDSDDVAGDADDASADSGEDAGKDVSTDGGCKDECSINVCKDNEILLVCKDWDDDGCKEFKEVGCGGGSECKNNICICAQPYQDCNSDMSDGCETNIKTNPARCGSCTNNCGDNSVCNEGICGCRYGFGNCDGKWSNGCEININEDPDHCGSCDKKCYDNSYCLDMKCECLKGFADCNPNAPGCETNLLSATSCGTDCNSIKNCGPNSACDAGSCQCKTGFADCNKDLLDGCERNILEDLQNCGKCYNECKPANVENMYCKEGKCDYDLCKEYFIDKDTQRENGCEYWTNFPKRYDNTQAKDEAAVILSDDEGILIGSNTINNQIWLLKADKYGEIIWQKIIQLKGIAKLKKGVSVINNTGNADGFLLAGTLENGDRIDIFTLRIAGNGNIVFAKSYNRQLPNTNKFNVSALIQIVEKGLFALAGSSEQTPLFLLINDDGSPVTIKYYLDGSSDTAIGVFSDLMLNIPQNFGIFRVYESRDY